MRSVVVLSGGLDSTVALYEILSKIHKSEVQTITFNYGSKHNEKENAAAKLISLYAGVKNTLVRLPFINEIFKSDLLQSGGEIPDGHYEDPSMQRTVVPFRNGIMLSVAAGFAESIGAKSVVLGNHAGDHAVYPDCRPEFTAFMGHAMNVGTYAKLDLVTPFGNMNKTGIVKRGLILSAPMHLTYSCYKGGEIHCGVCGTCVERKEAFRDSGMVDPTKYLQ